MPDIHMTRIDRVPVTVTVTATNADGSAGTVTGLDVAAVPTSGGPDASTKWRATTFATGTGSFTLSGPDADPTGAVAIPAAGAALYVRDTGADHTQATLAGRVSID